MAAGMWHLSGQQRHDLNGKPYPGARAFFYSASTLDPITVYKTYDLVVGTEHPDPVLADGFGIWPTVWINVDVGFYRFRTTTAAGVILNDEEVVPVIGPAVGEEAPAPEHPFDPLTVFQTGDLKYRLGEGFHSGWVLLNGTTIGNTGSSATQLNDSSTLALYTLIYNNFDDTLCPVIGGRSGNVTTDFVTNLRPITLPDCRGRVIAGLDDMGNSAAGRITSTTFTPNGITLGASGGEQTIFLTTAQLASHDHGATASSGTHTHFMAAAGATDTTLTAGLQVTQQRNEGGDDNNYNLRGSAVAATLGLTSPAVAHSHTTASAGGGNAHNNVQPSIAFTIYCKL